MARHTLARAVVLLAGSALGLDFDSCPDQVHKSRVTAETFGRIYRSELDVGATFDSSSDPTLKRIFDHAEACEFANVKEFLPGLDNVVEGSGYANVWLETQPMAGAMWAARNLTQALANQLVFMRTQRDDGRLPGMVVTDGQGNLLVVYCLCSHRDPVTHACQDEHGHSTFNKTDGGESLLQGQYFSNPALDVAFFLNLSSVPAARADALAYVEELRTVMEKFDGWMWLARSANGNVSDVLWTPGSSDWGGDGYDGYVGYQAPFLSMDMMAYAYSNADALRRASQLLRNSSGVAHWEAKMRSVAASLKRVLWDSKRGACYDQDAAGATVDVLVHNNLRCMWHGIFDQAMADEFVARHLRNTSEFWTPFPLPSIAADDPHFKPGLPRNSWSGPSEGLTYQRAIRALQNYGYHAEISLLGQRILDAVRQSMTFPQQWNPAPYDDPTAGPIAPGTAGKGDCYGPALLSALQYIGLMHGVVVLPGRGLLQWSSVVFDNRSSGVETGVAPSHVGNFTQTLGENVYSMAIGQSSVTGSRNTQILFESSRGVRILSDIKGRVVGVVGISPQPVALNLTIHSSSGGGRTDVVVTGAVVPNTEYAIVDGKLKVQRQVPFNGPPGSQSS